MTKFWFVIEENVIRGIKSDMDISLLLPMRSG